MSIQIDRVSFNKKEVENLGFKEFKNSFSHLLDKTPIEVAYKLATGKNPPTKSKDVRTHKDSTGEEQDGEV